MKNMNTQEEKPSQINGENKAVVNEKTDKTLNSENPKTENEQKTDIELSDAVNGSNPEPADKQSSGVLEEKA